MNFANSPEAVVVSPDLKDLLQRLVLKFEGALAVISGRSIYSLDQLLQIPNLPMAGGHGAEWRLSGLPTCSLSLNSHNFPIAVQRLTRFAASNNLITENKNHSFALHFRQQPHLEKAVDLFLAKNIAELTGLRTIYGNCVREIQPLGVDKGIAVERFMQVGVFIGREPVYIGDDVTDEDAFRWVNASRGVSIKVGQGSTVALHRLVDVAAVNRYLMSVLSQAE